jgi:DNA-binding NarL/FixJ family response regulator
MSDPTKILIADDNRLVRTGIAKLLSREEHLLVCGEATTADETIRKADELHPNVVLLDVSMPGSSGLDTARVLRQRSPQIKILIVSQHDPAQILQASLAAGASGCVDKSRLASDLVPSIKSLF